MGSAFDGEHGYSWSHSSDKAGSADLVNGTKRIYNDEPDYLEEDGIDREKCPDHYCFFYDERGYCVFETCMRDELPPMHKKWYRKCTICQRVYVVKLDHPFHEPHMHICEECRRKLEDVVLNNYEFRCGLCGAIQYGNREIPGMDMCDLCVDKARAVILPVLPAHARYNIAQYRHGSWQIKTPAMRWTYGDDSDVCFPQPFRQYPTSEECVQEGTVEPIVIKPKDPVINGSACNRHPELYPEVTDLNPMYDNNPTSPTSTHNGAGNEGDGNNEG